jgi:peptidoglycan/xylan/chitin deacetylase (PgdA/CDA1 family)
VARSLRVPTLLCLAYHRVADHVACHDGLISATPAELEWQGGWLRRHARVVGGDEIVALLGGASFTTSAVCLTFDDGYIDNFAAGLALARHGVPAIFFIPTGFVETGTIPWWDRLAYAAKHTARPTLAIRPVGGHGPWMLDNADHAAAARAARAIYRALPRSAQATFLEAVEAAAGVAADAATVGEQFMSWDQIRELRRLGHTIGAHTHTHPRLSALEPGEQRRELERSKRELEERLGEPVFLLAYPYGERHAFDDLTQQIAAACGIAGAFSFYGGRNRPPFARPYDLRRVSVDPGMPQRVFTARITSAFPL